MILLFYINPHQNSSTSLPYSSRLSAVHLQYGTQEKNRRVITRLLEGKIKSKK